jgi:DNA-directed RNA polymerase omega subunit
MIYPAADTLDAKYSKYALVIVSAKRAKQIKDGARLMIEDSESINPLTLALEEIAAGEIIPMMIGDPEKLPTSLPPTPVLGGLNASLGDEEDISSTSWMDAESTDVKDVLSTDEILPLPDDSIDIDLEVSDETDAYSLSDDSPVIDSNEDGNDDLEEVFTVDDE